MTTIVLVIHLLVAMSLVGVILIQRSEGGALAGLGGGNMGGLMSGRGTANLLTRATAILACCFIGTSLLLAILAARTNDATSILDAPAAPAMEHQQEETPETPREPSAPLAD